MLNSTVTQNEAPKGAGLARESGNPNAGLTLRNTLVMGNGRQEIYNIPTVRLASIVGVPAGLTLADILDPAGLGDHGGPTLTIALVESAANPAIEAGQASTCAAAPVSGLDQRGLPRVAPCDIGAFEVQP
jgi:hypothetical protein